LDNDDIDDVLLDLSRRERTGLSEAIFCEGKNLSQLTKICEQVNQENLSMLFTRLSLSMFSELDKRYPALIEYDDISRIGFSKPAKLGSRGANTDIAIVGAGSSDIAVVQEANMTLRYYGINSIQINDVGVAGLWRLTNRLDEISSMKIVICVAGMDAALPTVLAGLIPSSIIAVPSSVGYGMSRKGETALHALLASCASGMTVVNIDNGYGAACAAIRILNQL
jgi:NCAIR mutase (PurE)-related protein